MSPPSESEELPPMFATTEKVIIRGYGRDDRIVYGTGKVVMIDELKVSLAHLFDMADVAYIHIRSAGNTCYECWVDRS